MPDTPNETRKVEDIAQELREHPDVVAVKVWTVEDVLDSAGDWAEDHVVAMDKCEWDELERRVRSGEGTGRMKHALADCSDDEWDAVYDYVRVEIDDIVKSRKERLTWR